MGDILVNLRIGKYRDSSRFTQDGRHGFDKVVSGCGQLDDVKVLVDDSGWFG